MEIYEAQREKIIDGIKDLIEGRDELGQEIEKFGTAIHDLGAQLISKVDESNAQLNSNELCEVEKELIRQIEELKMESQSFEHMFVDDAHVEKSTLEPCEDADNVIFEDSSACKYEDVKSNTILELGRIGPHSIHFQHCVWMMKWKSSHLSLWRSQWTRNGVLTFLNSLCQKVKITILI